MIIIQYDPYTQSAEFWKKNKETGAKCELTDLKQEQDAALQELGNSIILQNQIERLISVLRQIESEPSLHFIGTKADFQDLTDDLAQLAPDVRAERDDTEFFLDASDVRAQLTEICNAVQRETERLTQKYPDHSDALRFDRAELDEILNGRTPLVFMGSSSAGKSSVINALIGAEVLPSGNGTTTEAVCEITPSRDQYTFSCRYARGECTLDFTKDKAAVTQALKAAFGKAIEFDTDDRYTWLYLTIKELSQHSELQIRDLRIRVPFKNLSEIADQIVIYDTPGPDSKTRTNHKDLLNEALSRFKKGVAIFVTGPNEIEKTTLRGFLDTYTKNSAQLQDILNVNAGIVLVNQADQSDIRSIEDGKASRKKHLQEKTDDDAGKQDFLLEQDRMVYFSSSYALRVHKGPDDRWQDTRLKKFCSSIHDMDDPNSELYLPLTTVAELPVLRKNAAIAAYEAAEARYLADRSEENQLELIAHNSGLRTLEAEIRFIVNTLSVCNLCAQAQKQLDLLLRAVQHSAEEIASEIGRQEQQKSDCLDEKYRELEQRLFGDTGSIKAQMLAAVESDKLREDPDDKKSTREALKSIFNSIRLKTNWSRIKKDPKTAMPDIIQKNERVQELAAERDRRAAEYCDTQFDSFKQACIAVVYEDHALNEDEKRALAACMQRWSPVALDKHQISFSKEDITKRFLFLKIADQYQCCDKAESCATNMFGDHRNKLWIAVHNCIVISCDRARNDFFSEEKIKQANPELKALSEQIAALHLQKNAYETFRKDLDSQLKTVRTLTNLQRKVSV